LPLPPINIRPTITDLPNGARSTRVHIKDAATADLGFIVTSLHVRR